MRENFARFAVLRNTFCQRGTLGTKKELFTMTFGLSICPADKRKVIDFKRVKKDFKAKTVIKNDPRYWMKVKNV